MLKEVTIEITNKCFNNCIYCSSEANELRKEQLTFDQIYQIILDTKSLGGTRINISGGEPLIHKDIEKIVSLINNLDIECVIYTSEIVNKNESISESLLRQIRKCEATLIFNLNTIKEETYNKITGTKDNFNVAITSIKRAKSIIGNKVEINFVPMKNNEKELKEVIEFAEQLEIKRVNILRLVVQGRATEDLEIDNSKLVDDKNGILRFGTPINKKKRPCTAGDEKIVIKANGSIIPCEAFKDKIYEIDNIESSSLYDVYTKSKNLKQIRNLVKQHNEACRNECCFIQYKKHEGI